MKHAIPAALAFLVTAMPALAQPPAHDDCLRVGQVDDFQPARDNRSLIVTDRLRHKYKVSLLGVCIDLKWKVGLGFRAKGAVGGLQCLSPGDEVITGRGDGGRCTIRKIEPYTPAMEKADAAAAAMKAQH